MGKVKALWEAERERKYEELKAKLLFHGYSDQEAHDMTVDEMEAEDAANGQFGVGA